MHEPYSDDQGVRWMLAYREGDEAAFDALVAEYSPQVYALLTRFLGPREGREDLVQEVFLRVIRARERYQPSARFSTWLYRIVFNLSINETQRASSREQTGGDRDPSHGAEMLLEIGDDRANDPVEELATLDVVAAVRRAIARLPETQRMALILAKYEEMPYVDIAAVIGTSEKAVKSLVHRARENLREWLAPHLQGDLS